MSFQIHSLPATPFRHLFGADESTLDAHGVTRMTAYCSPGFPCRISLQDAEIGETVLLLNYEHQPAGAAYRSRYAIFVREHAEEAAPARDEVPESISKRLISLRLFDGSDNLIDADVAQGDAIAAKIRAMFDNDAGAYIHLHNAKPGCFAALVTRS